MVADATNTKKLSGTGWHHTPSFEGIMKHSFSPPALMLRNLPSLALALALAILGVAGYKLLPVLLAEADHAVPATRCNPAEQPCNATLPGGGRLILTATPNPIRPLYPFRLSLRLMGVNAGNVEIDFDGVDMRMGINRVRLAPPIAPDEPFTGQGMLPVCVSGRMLWAATVLIDTPSGRVAVPFHFELPTH